MVDAVLKVLILHVARIGLSGKDSNLAGLSSKYSILNFFHSHHKHMSYIFIDLWFYKLSLSCVAK